jgi:uridine phosphorylase
MIAGVIVNRTQQEIPMRHDSSAVEIVVEAARRLLVTEM